MNNDPSLKLVVEGPADAQIVRAIIGKKLALRSRIFAAQGLTSLATIGRNILVHEGGPVLLVMDSETLDPRLTAELQAVNLAALSGALTSGMPFQTLPASYSHLFRVFTFMPEIEVVFFEAPQVLERMLGREPPQEKVKEGLLLPMRTLAELLEHAGVNRDYQALLEGMDARVQHAITSGRQAKALKASVESLLAVPAMAS